jgi:hypothetical protein
VKQQQIIAWLLFTLAFLVLVGMLLNVNIYWFVIDIVVILVCSGSGFFLLREQKQVE